MWITQLPANLEGDTAANSFTHLATDVLLIRSWLTHSGRLTHEVVTRKP